MLDCEKCEPCETDAVVVCDELETADPAKRIVVEDESSCKASIKEPDDVSLLQNIDSDVAWRNGSQSKQISIPLLQDQDIDNAPKIVVIENDGTVKNWQPSNVGDNFLAYWDGTQFTIGTLLSLLPAGDGVFVKNGASFSFQNGINGQYLTISGGNIQFQTVSPATPASGVIMCYGGTVAPAGWLLCDGAAYGRTLLDPSPQPVLFGILGTIYGAGNGTTTFNIPDLRGVFLRGLDSGRGVDPLRAIGTQQSNGFQSHNHGGSVGAELSHTHTLVGNTGGQSANHTHFIAADVRTTNPVTSTNYLARERPGSLIDSYDFAGTATAATIGKTSGISSGHTHSFSGTSGPGSSHNHSISPYGGSETRPVNLALNWIIKT